MKITNVTHSFLPDSVGGRENYVYNLAEGLGRKGYEIEVLTCGNGLLQKTHSTMYGHFTAYYFSSFNFPLKIATYRISLTMCARLLTDDTALIHAHDIHHFTTFIAAIAAKLRRKPLIITEHGYPSRPLEGPFNWVMKAYELAIIPVVNRFCQRFVATSNFIGQELASRYHVDPRKISILHNAVDPTPYAKPDRSFLDAFPITRQAFILTVGRQTKVKGFQHLIRAFEEVSKNHPEQMLVIVGPPAEYSTYLHELVKSLKLQQKVLFTGPIEYGKVISAIWLSRMVVIPSLYEPFGLIALEALSSGTPVIASKVGGLQEIIKDGVNGFLVKPGSEEELRDRIELLLADGNISRKFRENSRMTLQRFDWNRFLLAMEKIYRDQLGLDEISSAAIR